MFVLTFALSDLSRFLSSSIPASALAMSSLIWGSISLDIARWAACNSVSVINSKHCTPQKRASAWRSALTWRVGLVNKSEASDARTQARTGWTYASAGDHLVEARKVERSLLERRSRVCQLDHPKPH